MRLDYLTGLLTGKDIVDSHHCPICHVLELPSRCCEDKTHEVVNKDFNQESKFFIICGRVQEGVDRWVSCFVGDEFMRWERP